MLLASQRTLGVPSGLRKALAWHRDTLMVAVGYPDGAVRVWEVATGRLITTFTQAGPEGRLLWSPDGSHLASVAADGRIHLWSVTTGDLITMNKHPTHVIRALLSFPRRVRTGLFERSRFVPWGDWLDNRRVIVDALAWSSDGTRLATWGRQEDKIQVWDAATGQRITTLGNQTSFVQQIVWSPDGSRLAAADYSGKVQVWGTATGQQITTYTGSIYPVEAWSPAGEGSVPQDEESNSQVRDAITGGLVTDHDRATEDRAEVVKSPDGRHLASVASKETDVVHVYQVQMKTVRAARHISSYPGHSGDVYSVAWSPDGKRLASVSHDQAVQVWDVTTGHLTASFQTPGVREMAWSPDGSRLALATGADQAVQIRDAATGQTLLTYNNQASSVPVVLLSPDRSRLSWSPDGSRLALASEADQAVRIWDAATGQTLLTYNGHAEHVPDRGDFRNQWFVTWSPDGSRLASTSGAYGQAVQVWDATTGHLITTYSGHTHPVAVLAWSPAGSRLASTSNDRTVQVWDAATGRPLLTYRGHAKRRIIEDWGFPTVWSVAWSPDGSQLISGFDREEQVQVWDATTGKRLATYPGKILSGGTAWFPDGPRFALHAHETTMDIQVWQVP